MMSQLQSKRSLWLHLGIAAVTILVVVPLCRRGLILSDEGYLLQQALDLLDGRVIYRDMDSFVTPGVWFLLAGTFALFGASIFVSRVLMVLAAVGLTLVVFRIVRRLAGEPSGLAAVACTLVFFLWAFPAWTFAFYSPIAVLLALWGLERLLAFDESEQPRDLLLVGLLFGLSICFKQNYGVFAMAGAALGFLATRLERRTPLGESLSGLPRDLGLVALGAFAAGFPFLAYLLWHGAMGDAWQSLVIHPFEFSGKHDIPYASLGDLWRADLYTNGIEKLTYLSYPMLQSAPIMWLHDLRGVHRLHVLLYWLPPLLFCAGLVLALLPADRDERRLDGRLLTVVASCGLLFLGVLPRADFNHLVNVYQPVLVAGPIVVACLARRLPPVGGRVVFGLAGAIFLAYAGVALHWYGELLRTHRSELAMERGGVLITPMQSESVHRMLRALQKDSREGQAVLTVPDITMLNFLGARSVPSKYYNLYEHHIALDEGQAVVDGSEERDVQLVMTRYDNFFSDRVGLLDYAPRLASYIITHFERAYIGGGEEYIVYRRRPEPVDETPFADALADCAEGPGGGDVGRHLLFSSLYHRSIPTDPMPETGRRTPCRVRVPPGGGVLSLEIGYRKPFRVASGTTLSGRISVAHAGEQTTILEETLRVMKRQGTTIEHPYKRFEVDLSPWQGEAVELVFETRLDGEIRTHPLDYKGFAMVWRDPRVQAEPGGARP
jgi:4-amino-4-deoxy-L-arabinose transferase-like glycosyltransferase